MDEETTERIDEEAQQEAVGNDLEEFYRKFGGDERGLDAFFLEVIRTDDLSQLSKVGNLMDEEIGLPMIPVRTLMDLSQDCKKIPSCSTLGENFGHRAKTILTTSLSREGFLIKMRVTQKKEFDGGKKRKRYRKTLFGKKEVEESAIE